MHDRQVALPLASPTAEHVTNRYGLMDSAYDVPEIWEKSVARGHVAIIDPNPRRGGKAVAEAEARARRCAGHALAEDILFKQRSAAERVNSALEDNYGGRCVRVRGHDEVYCHLMFAIVALTVEQLMRRIT